jgi:hypothetical protein
MRRSLTSFCAVLAVAATAAAAPPAGAPPPAAPVGPPRTLGTLRTATVRAEERLLSLIADATMDQGLRRVRLYAGYTDLQLADPRRIGTGAPAIGDLLEVAMDEGKSVEVREEAVLALISDRATSLDPEFSTDGRKAARPRAKFSSKVLRYLNAPGDLVARSTAHRILVALWPQARDKEIKDYDPRKKETWGNARAAWTRFLGL